jgi:hypothetical protein
MPVAVDVVQKVIRSKVINIGGIPARRKSANKKEGAKSPGRFTASRKFTRFAAEIGETLWRSRVRKLAIQPVNYVNVAI